MGVQLHAGPADAQRLADRREHRRRLRLGGIIGNLLQDGVRLAVPRCRVFPDQISRDPELALKWRLPGGGFVEVAEDEFEARHTNAPQARWACRRRAQRHADSEFNNVSKSS